jgi:hypothetical membrane protein
MAQQTVVESTARVRNRVTRWLVAGGIVAPLLFVVCYLIAGSLRPGYSPVHQAISDLGVGPHAWLLNVDAIVSGLLLVGSALGFARAMRDILTPGWRWLCGVLLALHGLGLIIAGIFTEAPATLAIHWLVGADLGFFGPVVAFVVVGLRWRKLQQWRAWGAYTLVMALVALLAIAAMIVVFTPGTPLAPARLGGLLERIVLLVIQSWYLVVSWRLLDVSRQAPAHQRADGPA